MRRATSSRPSRSFAAPSASAEPWCARPWRRCGWAASCSPARASASSSRRRTTASGWPSRSTAPATRAPRCRSSNCAAISDITQAYDNWNALAGNDTSAAAAADFEFHLAIARATQNPQFPRFLEALGQDITLDLRLKHEHAADIHPKAHSKRIAREHGAILSAISLGDAKAARLALRRHLEESLVRYRRLFGTDATKSGD
jgi:hypothetical protein